jgi:undecaprenyl-diphosphatase
VALGALHGPAELWPVSSSAHINLVPWLLRWNYGGLDPELRKRFEVALHAGTALALASEWRPERGGLARLALSCAPPAAAGYALRTQISRHLGTPTSIAFGLIAGGIAMLVADRAPQRRTIAGARAVDALWLGVAQACALLPGVSRSGAALTAARLCGFNRRDAAALSEQAALPVILGATGLEARETLRRGLDPAAVRALAAGAGASLASALVGARLLPRLTDRISLRGFAAYRIALGSLVLALRPDSTARRCPGARA